jgi:hypothetical protein
MAEFKLGRIKFVWQGTWTTGTGYVVDDVVSNGGQSYVCVRNHTASSLFATDLGTNPTYWNLVAGGTNWTGDWTTNTYYNAGDQVKYGGTVYVATVAHTSAATTLLGLEADQAKWDAFASTFSWQQAWTTNTRYRVNDFVSYGGITYVCNQSHVSASTVADGLELDLSKWDEFNQGIIYLGDWTDTVRYRINDVVKYGASTWICTTAHTSTSSFDETKFDIFIEGMQFENTWSISTEYQVGDTVIYGGYSYIASANNIGRNPLTETAYWDVYTTGFNFRGDWDNATPYRVGDVVRLGGYTYLAKTDTTGNLPPNASYWDQLNSGIKWIDVSETYTAVTPVVLTGTGSTATFDVTRQGTVYTVFVNDGGIDFADNDTLKILGTDVGGLSPVNDISLVVASQTAGEISAVTVTGVAVTWTDTTVYNLGDIVFWAASSYICVDGHVADVLTNRPDVDTAGAYWNLMAAGSESSILTTDGDTYYYSENGPARLPVGTDGQILRVKNGYPTWAYYGVVNNLVYVSPTGTDSIGAGWGLTIDKPWNTVRFAAKQVEEGYLHRNSTTILKKNKQFIMKEISNWVTYTYSVAITASSSGTNAFLCDSTANLTVNMPIEFDGTVGGVVAGTKYFVKTITDDTHFVISATQGGIAFTLTSQTANMTGSLSYDYDFCQRDAGMLVDALVFDIGHGGNEEITNAALAYYTPAGTAYINSNFGQQTTQTIAAYNYMKTLVSRVVTNTPAISYQYLNGITDGPKQHLEPSTFAVDAGIATEVELLLSVVTDGIAVGSKTGIPAAVFATNTISVKTGTFFEVLPIVIPRNTAVVGDELRGTVIRPQPAIPSLAKDKPKTISALNRIKGVIPNLLSNTTISSSNGNDVAQSFIYDGYESILESATDENIGIMKSIIQGNTAPATVLIDPSNYDTGYFNARRLLVANKEFLQAEVSAWIDAQILANTAPFSGFVYAGTLRTDTEEDVGYIVDAIAYDLTYGGNLQTVVTARSYYSLGAFVGTLPKTQSLAVQARIQDIIDNIVTGNTAGWTETPANAETQDVSGTPGSAGAASFAQARVLEIYNTTDTGTAPTAILPSTAWVNPRLVAAHTSLQTAKTALRENVISWITSNYPDLVFNQTLCSRDIGYIIDALGYDAMFGSNFSSITSGMSYQRGIASTEVVLNDQLMPTLGALDYLNDLVKKTTQGTDTLIKNLNEMTSVLANGITTLPSFVYTDPVGFDSGYYHARRLLVANKAFVVAELSAWIYAQIAGNIAPFNTGFTYGGEDQVKCERDVGYIVDALTFDLTYGGNLGTVIAGRAYYTNGVYVGDSASKARALAVQLRIKDIVDNIVTGDTAGWTETPANALVQDVSGTAGSVGSGTFAQARVQEIYDAINTGTAPTTIAPVITWSSAELQASYAAIQAAKNHIQASAIKWVIDTYPTLTFNATTCSRDVGLIVDALAYDLVLGSNFLSVWNAMSYYRGLVSTEVVIEAQLQPTIGIIGYVGGAVIESARGISNLTGNTVASDRISVSANTIADVLNNGINSIPVEVMPAPSNIDAGYSNAVIQILNNYAFIKADVSYYLVNNFNSIWVGLGATGQAACQRDVGYILDAIRYDLTYSGNTQTLIAGRAYYNYINLVIAESEVPATLAAYTHLQSIIDNIVTKAVITPQAGNSVTRSLAGTAGSAGAATFAQARVQDVIDWIDDGVSPTAIAPDTSWVESNLVDGANRLLNNKTEIQSDGLAYVRKFFQELSFNEATCSRDIGYMIDALAYDMMFGSNFAAIITGKSYHRALTSAQLVLASQKNASMGLIKFLKYKAKAVATGGAVAQLSETIDDLVGTINGGATPRILWKDYTGIDAENYAGAKLIWQNTDFIARETLQYIATNYPAVVYSASACARDVGLIIDALRYDLTYGGNSATRQAAIAYYSQLTDELQIDVADKTATLAAYTNMRTLIQDIAQGGTSYAALQTGITRITGTTGDATTASTVGTLITSLIDYIDDKDANPITETLPSTAWVATAKVTQAGLLLSAKTTIIGLVTDFINSEYPNLNYDSITCERDVGYIIDALAYDLMMESNFRSIKAGSSYHQAQAKLAITGVQRKPTLQAMRYLYRLVTDTVNTNAVALASVKHNMRTIISIIEFGVGETPEVYGTMSYYNNTTLYRAAEILKANKAYLASEATAWITQSYGGTVTDTSSINSTLTTSTNHNFTVGDPVIFTNAFGGVASDLVYYIYTVPSDTTFTVATSLTATTPVSLTTSSSSAIVRYAFDAEACARDMSEYVDALASDLNWSSNYRSNRAAVLYVNAVKGSEYSDMFRTRNACGLRNCTLSGLDGDLTEDNDYGTKRPTAGAFVALDQGFGPNDEEVWVLTRSHYSQNVSMFGTGCTGAKIDSALHSGGNKSMVKNDFTTIISDGIGVWCTGSDSLTELVSVFNYYGYAGYLAELGGRIRATNGNSSYGTYGIIAEGVASSETPLYGTINNRAAQAQITNTVTDGTSQILRFEFGNAGSNYTNALHVVNGAGYNAAAIADEFRDGAVFETRIIDINNSEGVGGTSYVTASNAAQSGDTTSITIAATDQALSAAYVGMRIQIVAGSGVGQFANIATYNTGSKIATVTKPSTGAAGWDHVVPGTPIESFLDLTTSYIIEPQITYTAPGYLATARSMATSVDWQQVVYGDRKFVAIEASGTVANFSTTGKTWANAGALSANASWRDVVYGGGEGSSAYAVIGGLGGVGAVLEAVFGTPNVNGDPTEDQIASVRVIDGGQGYTTPPTITFTATSGGIGATAIASVLDGKIKEVTVTIPGSGYNQLPIVTATTDKVTQGVVNAWGRHYFSDPTITIEDPFTGAAWASSVPVSLNDIIYRTNTGVVPNVKNWYRVTVAGTTTTTGPTHGNGTTATNGTATLLHIGVSAVLVPSRISDAGLVDGLVSLSVQQSGSGYTFTPAVTVIDSAARYVAIATGSGDNCFTTRTGIETAAAWTAGTGTGKTDLVALSYGNGVYVSVGGTASAVSSTNGNTWISRTIPTLGAGLYSDVQYGNDVFVAIASGSLVTAISTNGNSWTAGGNMPSSAAWGSVVYGNGRFVAIETGTSSTKAAISYDKGTTWIATVLPASTTWSKIGYGQGLFFAIASGTTICATSPDGITWTQRAMTSSSGWRAIAFGNPASDPIWSVISGTTGTIAATVKTGATATGRVSVASGTVIEVRMIEPGSGYPTGVVSATTESGSVITTNDTTNLINAQPIEFEGVTSGGLAENVTYYVIGSTIVLNTSFKVSATAGSSTPVTLVTTTGLTGTYRAGPTFTLTDPNKVKTANLRIRTGDGALGNPSFTDRGEDNTTATSQTDGDGYANLYQPSTFIDVAGLYEAPVPGSNVEFASLPGEYYKLVTVTNLQGNKGNYTATFQLNPGLTVLKAPSHGDLITTRIKYSQVRLTGHDYLYIGTGNKTRTGYPYVDITQAIQSNQELFSGGGRAFFTSTDQDGNFNVGDLFGVQQATGTATLNASAFNLSGLNSLQLGALELGVDSAIITQFSTDPFFTADSDNIVPTQRAIRAYITAQIGGGQSSLNVNTLTSGIIYIAGNSISTTTGAGINITSRMNFTGGITGSPVALAFFMQR